LVVGLLNRLFGRAEQNEGAPLYAAVVERARQPHWYLEGAVPDTVEGRFEMVTAVLSMVLLRLEADSAGATLAVRATECFVDDMDAQLRQDGVGDVGIGKRVGRMMAMLGGRLGAYRDALAAGDLVPALARNLYRGAAVAPAAQTAVAARLTQFARALGETPIATMAQGQLP